MTGYFYPAEYYEDIFNFIIYIVKNEPCIKLLHEYIEALKFYALSGHIGAKNYLLDQINNENQYLSIQLHLHAINLAFGKNNTSFEFLKKHILEAQDVETTDVSYYSPIESIINRWISGICRIRYYNGKDYDDIVELTGLLIRSRCKGMQEFVAMHYVAIQDPQTIEKRAKDLWEIIDNPSYTREEYLDALYEILGYRMRRTSRFPEQFKPKLRYGRMDVYLNKLVKPNVVSVDEIYFDEENSEIKENRISKEEKIYFYKRIRFYTGGDKGYKKYILNEPLFREIEDEK